MNTQLLGAVVMGAAIVNAQEAARRVRVAFPDKTMVSAEVADTEPTRQKGLMFRKELAQDEGMLFVFDAPGEHPFWMKNTLIPLDMIWLDTDMRVLHIAHAVPPCKADPCPEYPPPPGTRASYVLELAAGVAKGHKLQPDQKLVVTGLVR